MARLFNATLNIHYFISNNAVASFIFALADRIKDILLCIYSIFYWTYHPRLFLL